ncbi:MAG: hypothetical protein U9R29_10260 [Thermodesulfobacteriota bacterium]|nr:hypothetical protein [Thermodesulfobacteriota bacterium]
MTTFEVHYQQGTEYGEALVDAQYPEQARQTFLQQNTEKDLVVLCIIRHQLPY